MEVDVRDHWRLVRVSFAKMPPSGKTVHTDRSISSFVKSGQVINHLSRLPISQLSNRILLSLRSGCKSSGDTRVDIRNPERHISSRFGNWFEKSGKLVHKVASALARATVLRFECFPIGIGSGYRGIR